MPTPKPALLKQPPPEWTEFVPGLWYDRSGKYACVRLGLDWLAVERETSTYIGQACRSLEEAKARVNGHRLGLLS